MTAPAAQLIIAYDGLDLKVEAAGANGARAKIDGVLFTELPIEIRTALIDQLDRIKAKQRADLMATQSQNIQYVAETHNIGLAQKIWGNEKALSRTQRARLRYSHEGAGNIDASGKAKKIDKGDKFEIMEL
jgi:hypothetical protein